MAKQRECKPSRDAVELWLVGGLVVLNFLSLIWWR